MGGTDFGRYRLIELLGRGGMGEVWRAFDTGTNRQVAIKVLPAHFAQDPAFDARFRREADLAASLNNPHIVPIHDYGEIDGRLFVDMRLIEGHDLAAELADGPLPPGRAVLIVEHVAKALRAAHRAGLVHRDVKPSNILIDEDDEAYLIDFGIARAVADTGLTGTGTTIGTWAYMAPERFSDDAIDARVDVYALACVLCECLTGAVPYPATSFEKIAAGHMFTPPPQPTRMRAGLAPGFDEVIATGMAKDPEQRYPGARELAVAARAALTTPHPVTPTVVAATTPASLLASSTEPTRDATRSPEPAAAERSSRRPAVLAAVAVAAVLVVVVAVIGFNQRDSPTDSTTTPVSTAAAQPPTTVTDEDGYGEPIALPFTGLTNAHGVAVDTTGAVYITDYGNGAGTARVLKLAAGATTPDTALALTGLSSPYGVAVDTAGAVYVVDLLNNQVLKLAAGATTPETLPFTGLDSPGGVAVDTTGAVYVADSGNDRVLKLAAGATTADTLPFAGIDGPEGVAVDTTGAVYATDYINDRVLKLAAGATTAEALPFTGMEGPQGVAVDATGAVYVTDLHNHRVLKLAVGAATADPLPFTNLGYPSGVAVDGTGAVYVINSGKHRVQKLPVS